MSKDARHSRTVPPKWPKLLAYAERVVPEKLPDKYVPKWPLARLFLRANLLSNEALEANCYYGFGEIATEMAKLLQHKKIRDQVILSAAGMMLESAIQTRPFTVPINRPFVPRVGDLFNYQGMQDAFLPIAGAAMRAFAAPKHALVDVLAATMNHRRAIAKNPINIMKGREFFEYARTELIAARQVTANSLSGASFTYRTRLGAVGLNPPIERLMAPLTKESMQSVWDLSTFMGVAQMRLDELQQGYGWGKGGDPTVFDTEFLKTPPLPLSECPYAAQLHEERLTCPGIQAGGFAREMAEHILPEIIQTASTFVPEKIV